MTSSLTPVVTEGQEGTAAPGRRWPRILGAAVAVLVAFVVVVSAAAFVLSVRVDGGSMLPTLHTGDRLLPEPGSGGAVHRFEVVLLQRPGRDEVLVKRVIALPGDRVEIVSTPADPYQVLVQPSGSGPWFRVRVDAWPAQAHRASSCCGPDGTRSDAPQPQTVPAGSFFYLGDDPDGSYDSRAYGWGRIDLVTGRVWLRLWPFGGPSALTAGARLEPVQTPSPASVG